MSPSRRTSESTLAGTIASVLIALLLSSPLGITTPESCRADTLAGPFGPIAIDVPYEARGNALSGLSVVIDPDGGEVPAQAATVDPSQRVAWRTNFAIAALLRHHITDSGGACALTRQDDRAASTTPACQLAARAAVVQHTHPHFVLTLASVAATSTTSHEILFAPRDTTASQLAAARLADELAEALSRQGMKLTVPRPAPLLLAQQTQAPVIELRLALAHRPPSPDWRPSREITLPVAQAIHETLLRAWTNPHTADLLRDAQARAFPEAPPEPATLANALPDQVTTEVAKLATTLWPFETPPRTPKEARFVLENYRRRLCEATFFYLDFQVELTSATWKLRVRSNFEELASACAGILRALGCRPLATECEILPARDRLNDHLHGVTLASAALTWGTPNEGDDVQTQLLPGEPVWLLDRTASHYLVQASDGYVGWVRADSIAPIAPTEFERLLNAPSATLAAPWSDGRLDLSPGCRFPLHPDHAELLARPSPLPPTLRLLLPRPLAQSLGHDTVEIPSRWLRLPPRGVAKNLAETAAGLYATPYVFGGRSANGLDCSGLVGVTYEALGLRLPRDARQQAWVGRLVATRWDRSALRPGDILFFIDKTGRVIHTALALDTDRFIHSCPPCVRVNSLSGGALGFDPTWARAFALARRPWAEHPALAREPKGPARNSAPARSAHHRGPPR